VAINEETKQQLTRTLAAFTLIGESMAGMSSALTAFSAELAALKDLVDGDEEPRPVLHATLGATTAVLVWSGTAKRWRIGRGGTDTQGSGPWSTETDKNTITLGNLRPGDSYVITLTPLDPPGDPVSITIKMTGTVPPPPPPTGGYAEQLGWGTRTIWRDEFDYTGEPDRSRWMQCGERGIGWDGHAKNGRRMPECTEVRNGMLVLTGKTNGHTGWIRALNYARYGRVEFRMRSRNLGPSGATYHPLGLWWPTEPEEWPENGELDALEYTDPDSKTASAWLHYPHRSGIDIQQAGPFTTPCDMTQWNVFNVEWNSTGVRAWINGKKWYDVRDGGGPNGRKNIQDMTKGMWHFQLDNFSKDGPWRPAVQEIDYIRFYPV
jgi:hypothetical protein